MRMLICIFLICAACLWKTVIKLKGYRFSVQATLNKWLWTWFFKSVNVGWVISGLVPGQSWEHHHKTQMGYNQHSSRQHRVPADPYRRHTSLNRSLNAQCFTYDSHKCRRSYNHTHTHKLLETNVYCFNTVHDPTHMNVHTQSTALLKPSVLVNRKCIFFSWNSEYVCCYMWGCLH